MKLRPGKKETIKKNFFVVEEKNGDISVYANKKNIPDDVAEFEEHFIEFSKPTYKDFLDFQQSGGFGLGDTFAEKLPVVIRLITNWSFKEDEDEIKEESKEKKETDMLEIKLANLESFYPAISDAIVYFVQDQILFQNKIAE